ncbi:MAG: phosphate signaling complex protein PhoU [Nitrospinales bacterium]
MTKHSVHFEKQIGKLKKMILSLSAMVEESLRTSLISIEKRNTPLAMKVIESDAEVDRLEVELEEECLKTLALYQPIFANDLRLIVAILKINNDLERIADLAVNIAERSIDLSRQGTWQIPSAFKEMGDKAQWMLKAALDAFIGLDAGLSRRICAADDEVDGFLRAMYLKTEKEIREQPDLLNRLIHFLSVCRYIERIADHVTNIAEDVIYMVEGEIVRHKSEFLQPREDEDKRK